MPRAVVTHAHSDHARAGSGQYLATPGAAQVRVEVAGEVWVVSGDYKTEADGLAEPFEPVACHGFVTECTFGLPVYRWAPQAQVPYAARRARLDRLCAALPHGAPLRVAERVTAPDWPGRAQAR